MNLSNIIVKQKAKSGIHIGGGNKDWITIDWNFVYDTEQIQICNVFQKFDHNIYTAIQDNVQLFAGDSELSLNKKQMIQSGNMGTLLKLICQQFDF